MEIELKCSNCSVDLIHNEGYLTQTGLMVCEKCAAPLFDIPNDSPQEEPLKKIPYAMLNNLKCIQCPNLLSCGPVYCHKNASICGRCKPPNSFLSRNIAYEVLAELMLFPCRYKRNGCSVLIPYSKDKEPDHEINCSFRIYTCPLIFPECDWKGTKSEYLEHCKTNHPDRMLENPCNLSYDFAIESECSFLFSVFEHLFLLHSKVCMKSYNIYHTVQQVTESDNDHYNFTVSIIRYTKMVKRKGEITQNQELDFNAKYVLKTNIKCLEKSLGGIDNCVFTIMINKELKRCQKCKKEVRQFWYKEDGEWTCESCIPVDMTICKNMNCSHADIEKKCQKHEIYFCPHGKWCWLCKKDIWSHDIITHYNSEHTTTSQKEGVPWKIQQDGIYDKTIVFMINSHIALIKYKYSRSVFMIQIQTAIPTQKLHEYGCAVKVSLTDKYEEEKIFILKTSYVEMYDWKLEEKNLFTKDFMYLTVYIYKNKQAPVFNTENIVHQ